MNVAVVTDEEIPTFDKEGVYDSDISPLMKEIVKACKEHGIHMVCDFYIGNTEDKPELHCTTYMEPDTNVSTNTENAAKLLRAMVTKEDRDNTPLLAALHATVLDASIKANSPSEMEEYTKYDVGDWVIETSFAVFNRPQLDIFGKVLEIEESKIDPHLKRVLIRKINGHTTWWDNARFLKVPSTKVIDQYFEYDTDDESDIEGDE